MAITVTHTTVATGTDAGNGEIRKAQWNENHTLTAAAGTVLGAQVGSTTVTDLPIGVDSSGYVGMGAAPGNNARLTLQEPAANRGLFFADSTGNAGGYIGTSGDAGTANKLLINASRGAGKLILQTVSTNALTIDANQNSAFAGRLQVVGTRYVPYVFAQSGNPASVGAVTTEATLATVSFSGGELGPNGWIQVIMQWTMTNNANVKDTRVRLGGAAGTIYTSPTLTSITGMVRFVSIMNQNSASSQRCASPGGNGIGIGTFSSTGVTSTVNTASAWDLLITGQKAVSGDTLTLEGYQVIVCYGA